MQILVFGHRLVMAEVGGQEEVLEDAVLQPALAGRGLQEPQGPAGPPLVQPGALLAERRPQLVPRHEPRRLRELHRV